MTARIEGEAADGGGIGDGNNIVGTTKDDIIAGTDTGVSVVEVAGTVGPILKVAACEAAARPRVAAPTATTAA
ncbi:MAG: hypothetical protein FWD61_09670 [Phycisphaerales bacterium]|nr:hypothetical protein [Phycisphaerales bacterium]